MPKPLPRLALHPEARDEKPAAQNPAPELEEDRITDRVCRPTGAQKRAIRRQLWRKQHGRCAHCGGPMQRVATRDNADVAATIDHVIPICQGGTNNRENLELVHGRCNQERAVQLGLLQGSKPYLCP